MTHARKIGFTARRLLKRLGYTAGIFAGVVTLFALAFFFTQDVSLLDAFYWSIVTGFTVGFGDVLPTIAVSKVLTMLYIPISFVLASIFVGHIVGLVQEARTDFTAEDEAKLFGDLQELKCEMQALVNHLNLDVDYSEDGDDNR